MLRSGRNLEEYGKSFGYEHSRSGCGNPGGHLLGTHVNLQWKGHGAANRKQQQVNRPFWAGLSASRHAKELILPQTHFASHKMQSIDIMGNKKARKIFDHLNSAMGHIL